MIAPSPPPSLDLFKAGTAAAHEKREKIRISLDLTPELNERLQQIADTTGGTKSEVIRKALALMDVAIQAKKNNARILITDKDETREIVGLF